MTKIGPGPIPAGMEVETWFRTPYEDGSPLKYFRDRDAAKFTAFNPKNRTSRPIEEVLVLTDGGEKGTLLSTNEEVFICPISIKKIQDFRQSELLLQMTGVEADLFTPN